MKKIILLFTIIITCLVLSSCASKKEKQERPVQERSEDFIADVNSIFLGNLHLYTKQSINSPHITDFDVYFSPRTNSVFLQFRLSIDIVQISFTYQERKAIYQSAQKYIENYENDLLIDEKPTSKNASYKGTGPITWGVFGLTHYVDTKYMVNTEYVWIEKPYYRLRYESTKSTEDDSNSPAFSIYISPSQWETIFEMCNQQALEAHVDEILSEAEAF